MLSAQRLPRDCTLALHRQVFKWVGRVDPTLATALHDRGQRLAVAVGADEAGADAAGADAAIPAGNFAAFTVAPVQSHGGSDYFITLLPDGERLFSHLCAAIAHEPAVEVDRVVVPLAAQPRTVAARSYDDLVEHAAQSYCVRLRFSTPTHFTVAGVSSVLPEPARVFKGYAERWNAFAPARLAIDLEAREQWIKTSVEIADCEIRTEKRVLRKGSRHVTHVSFVGQVTYEVIRPARDDAAALRTLNALADFAEFCGTGRMAAQGFGQTWRLDVAH